MRVVLVSLARRGGMVHFLAEVAGGLAPLADLVAIISARAPADLLPRGIRTLTVETGAGRLSSLARLISPLNWHRLSSQIRALRPEIVHIVGAHEWNALISLILPIPGRTIGIYGTRSGIPSGRTLDDKSGRLAYSPACIPARDVDPRWKAAAAAAGRTPRARSRCAASNVLVVPALEAASGAVRKDHPVLWQAGGI
jgi:hypothetical protein